MPSQQIKFTQVTALAPDSIVAVDTDGVLWRGTFSDAEHIDWVRVVPPREETPSGEAKLRGPPGRAQDVATGIAKG